MKSEKLNVKEIVLKDSAVFIADVHYKKGDEDFLNLLKKWLKNPPPQIFFVGDIFHLMLPFSFLYEYNKDVIELIKKLAKKTEVYYMYGNHDFNFKIDGVIFADAFVDKEKSVFITHGDLTNKDLFYKLYAKIIRNFYFEKFLNLVSFNFLNNWLFKKILNKKIKCVKLKNFNKKFSHKLKKFDIIIEGHYHQGKMMKKNKKIYFNLPAFTCTKTFILLKLDKEVFLKEVNGR